MHTMLAGKTVALCVTGSVAAYKAVLVARLLVQSGAKVLPVMSASGARFVGPVTLSGITGQPVALDMWDPSHPGEKHVDLAREADLVAVVPATADVLARFAGGRADDLVTALVLVARGPVLCAPAMHPRMWDHPATRANVAKLAAQGRVELVGPVSGVVASGEEGEGRMAEPEDIVRAIGARLGVAGPAKRDLAGLHFVVSAGPTEEALDPVRYLGNRSSGKTGFAIAANAARRGARVTLVAGPTSLSTPAGVERVDVRSARDMQQALLAATGADLERADAVIMAAAVADFRPREPRATKIKKGDLGGDLTITLEANPDLLKELGTLRAASGRARPVLVGFALETGVDDELVAYARGKLVAKKVDFVVANRADVALSGDATQLFFVDAFGVESTGPVPKTTAAERVVDRVAALLV